MERNDLQMYPLSHALALLEIKEGLTEITKKVSALPEPVDSAEEQAVKEQVTRFLDALEERGLYEPA